MRQGPQNRRGRGRNRRGHSPLTRSFESNGPDVKIRGTPAHIGEKYMSLARDAAASGDPVLAENYLQHAEHYNRIIMAVREQQGGPNGSDAEHGMTRNRGANGGGDFYDAPEDYAEDEGDFGGEGPVHAAEVGAHPAEAPSRDDRPARRMPDQSGYRPPRDRQSGDTRGRGFDRHAQATGEPRNDISGRVAPEREQPRRRERFQAEAHEQPEFLRRSVRRPRRESNGTPAADDPNEGNE